jgi:signal transduction histidine kinase
MSIRLRLTLFHALTMVLIVALLTGVLIAAIFVVMHLMVERPTRERGNDAAALVQANGTLTAADLARLSEGDIFVILRDERGRIVAQSDGVPPKVLAQDNLLLSRAEGAGNSSSEEIDGNYVYVVGIQTSSGQSLVVETGQPYTVVDEGPLRLTMAPPGLAGIAAGAALVTVLPAIAASYLVARRALRPVNAIVRSVQTISEEDLSRRLPVRSRRDELGRLALTFNELLARLEVAFSEREETLASQRRFVANAGHELRTPLSSILGYARLLREWGLKDPDVAEESLGAIEREAARMSELVEEMLDLARGDEGLPLELEEVDVRDIAGAAVEAARVAPTTGIEIIYQPPLAPIIARVDADRVRQALGILLDNAVKYTPEGGMVIVRVHNAGESVELEVSDTGIGIAPAHLPYIFDRFYRVDSARSHAGSGLGLSIARQIADLHGGTITVTSRPGQGSTFILRMPRSGPASSK